MFWDAIKSWFLGERLKRQSRSQPIRRRKIPELDLKYFPKSEDPGCFVDKYQKQFEDDPEFAKWSDNVKEVIQRERDKLKI